jgi:hypothetical protein
MTLASEVEPSSFSHFRLAFKSGHKVMASTVFGRRYPVVFAARDRVGQDNRRIRGISCDRAAQIGGFIEHFNHHRDHETLENPTPADVTFGRGQGTLEERGHINPGAEHRDSVDKPCSGSKAGFIEIAYRQ